MKKITKQLMAFGISGLLVGSGIGALGNMFFTQPKIIEVVKEIPVEKIVTHTVEVPVEVIKEVPVNVTVEKIVEVDNGNFDYLTERLEDMEIFNDAKEIIDELKAEDKAKELAFEFVLDNLEDELENEDLVDDEDDVRLIKMYKEYDDVEIIDSDFDNNEYIFKIKVKYEDTHSEIKKYAFFTVKVEDDEPRLVSLTD